MMRGLATPLPWLRRRRALSRNGRGRCGLPIVRSRVPAAVGPAPARAGGCERESVGRGGRPEEAGEFASDGDGADVAGFSACAQTAVEAVEAVLGAPGDLEHVRGLALLAV